MKLRFAFVGFRHGHILSLLAAAKKSPSIEVVALCEEDEATRAQLAAEGNHTITHDSIEKLLAEVECDVIAVGDYYGKRGGIVKAALKAGKHVISDKPLCISLDELDEIEALAKAGNRQVGLQLDLRDAGPILALRDVIRSGQIGKIVTIHISAQHALNLGKRPAWYFVPGAHGGTINDIGIHAFDLIPWLTGQEFDSVLAARSWNAKAVDFPHFEDSAQIMARLKDGAGVLADFSYLAPTQCGFAEPDYWRVTCHGMTGVVSTYYSAKEVRVVTDGDTAPRHLPAPAAADNKYLEDFLLCIAGRSQEAALTTEKVFTATRLALQAQAAATK